MSIELGATHMRYFFATILLLVGFQAFGQSNNRCVPNNPADTLTINRCFDSAQYYFNGQDYLKAASFFHEAEYIIPNCSDILENLAVCYWEHTQNGSKSDAKRLLIAKKYLELCVQDKWIPRNRKNNYQNCLDEINNVLGRILVQKNYSNGTYYGEMQNNNREGFGIFYFTNGQRYEGRWIDDKKEDFEGELYNSRNVLIYKGFFHNNEKLDYEKPDLADDIDYWESIKNSNDTAAYRRYLDKFGETGLYKDDARKKIAILQPSDTQRNDAVKDSILAEIDDYIRDINIEMKREGLERNIIDFSYSLSGYYSLRTGSMHHNRWGYYSGCGIKGDVINDGIYGINSMRYTIGALYAPTYWMYVYAGGGLTIDSLNANDNFTSTAELGLLFKLGALSLSTGIQADDFLHEPSIDFNVGLGLNLNAFRMKYAPFTYYVYSPMAPYGIMCAWYRNSISGYFKIQIPMYGDKIQELVFPDYHNHPVRYSYTAGLTTSHSSWLGFYAGLGLGVYKNRLDDETQRKGLDAEIGASLRISHYLSASAGLHGVNMTDKDRFLTYDIGIGISTWKVLLKRADHTIWEYSFSETADIGLMNGFISNWYGYYSRIQFTNPFQENEQHNVSDKWNGSRYSMTAGPIIALTDWLYIHGGIGMGIYSKNNSYKTPDLGFETEVGASLKAWLFDVSFGPHWCRVGKDDAFLDYNLGVGVNIPRWLGNSAFGNHGAPFGSFRYSGYTRFGMDFGVVYDEGGFYIGFLEALPEIRLNFSAGVIFTPSALTHFSIGPGIGIYADGANPALGLDMEAMFSFVLWKFPVTIGIKACRIGSQQMFFEPIYGLGAFQFE